jgi:hypothetical protein
MLKVTDEDPIFHPGGDTGCDIGQCSDPNTDLPDTCGAPSTSANSAVKVTGGDLGQGSPKNDSPDAYSAPFTLADCPTTYTNIGLSCERESDTYDKVSGVPCKEGYTNNKTTCSREMSVKELTCPVGRVKIGDRCYGPCRAGYTNNGKTCDRDISPKNDSPDTYTAPSTLADCPSAYANIGLICERGSDTYDKVYGVPCKEGYTNNNTTCRRDISVTGQGSMTCPASRLKIGGMCYGPCKTGYTNHVGTCKRNVSRSLTQIAGEHQHRITQY